jgi:hypothetical protein
MVAIDAAVGAVVLASLDAGSGVFVTIGAALDASVMALRGRGAAGEEQEGGGEEEEEGFHGLLDWWIGGLLEATVWTWRRDAALTGRPEARRYMRRRSGGYIASKRAWERASMASLRMARRSARP